MRKLFIYAYDRVNLGDDLFVHTIANRYPDVKFYLWSSAVNKTTFSCLKNVVVLDKDSSWMKFLNKIRPSLTVRRKNKLEMACDAVVYIGGSLFIEFENWKQILNWWEYEALNRHFYVLGANFGPYHTEAYRERISGIFANMKDVCFRDRYSYSLFSDIETVRCAPDILFSYPMKNETSREKQVFVSVIDCASKEEGDNKLINYEQAYIENMSSMLTELIEKGYKVVLSSFCKCEGDENAVEKICSQIPSEMTTVINYNGVNSQEVLAQIEKSAFIIASRFHAAILGFAAEKPVLPVIYSDKTKYVLEDVGFKGIYLDIRCLEHLDVNNVISNINNQMLDNIDEIKKDAQLHFKKLDNIFNL